MRVVVRLVVQRRQRGAAGGGAFAAHPRTALAMCMSMKFAFFGAAFAGLDAGRQQCPDQLAVATGAAAPDPIGGSADVGAVVAQADALAHVHRLGDAGIGAAVADRRADHRLPDGEAERLIVGPRSDMRMLGNHLLDRQGKSPWLQS